MIRERGSALVAVLVVSMLSSMIAVSLLYRLLADEHASKAGLGARKAWEAAMSGVEVAAAVAHRHFLDPTRWRDRPEIFHAQLVSDDGVDRWYFTVYSPGDAPAADGESSVRYGLSDEGARFNLRMIPREVLASIPGLDDALAGALFAATGRETPAVEAPDATNAADGGGDAAEAPLSYTLRNAPFRTLDEIALVPGFGVELLYGEDADGDGRLDPEEDDGATRPPNDDGDGVLDGGLRDWLTVWNVGLAVDANRVPQVDLNRDVERLGELELSDGTLRFLALSRKQAQEAGLDQAFIHPVELLDARIEVPIEEDGDASADGVSGAGDGTTGGGEEGEGDGAADPDDDATPRTEVVESGIGAAEIAAILDRTKAHEFERYVSFTLNVNTASVEALALIPGIDASLASTIVARRSELSAEALRTPAWLLEEGLLDREEFVRVAPYLTTKSFQFRFRVIGYGIPSGRYRILEALVDVGHAEPRLIYLRELTRAGPPFPLEGREQDA